MPIGGLIDEFVTTSKYVGDDVTASQHLNKYDSVTMSKEGDAWRFMGEGDDLDTLGKGGLATGAAAGGLAGLGGLAVPVWVPWLALAAILGGWLLVLED